MKIDTNLIPNFDALPEEAKTAILGMEFADAPDMSQFVAKAVFDKKASEAADLGKQLKARMTEEELAKAQAAEEREAMMKELEAFRAKDVINEYTTQFMGIGYDAELAKATATAIQKGDMSAMFRNHAKFITEREKVMKAELLKSTPTPPAGDGDKGVTKEDIKKMNLAEQAKFARENPEIYKEFYGGN